MKFLIVFACLLAVAFAEFDTDINVLKTDQNPEGYDTHLELANGVKIVQSGKLHDGEELIVKGTHEHISPEGEHVSIEYVADKNGYQVVAANPPLPTPPPTPEAILRSLEWIAAHPSKE